MCSLSLKNNVFIFCGLPDRKRGDFAQRVIRNESMGLTGGVNLNKVEAYQTQKRLMFIR